MKIHPDGEWLRLRVKDPGRITSMTLGSKQLDSHFVDVPFTLSNVLSLRMLDMKAPSPIGWHYGWPGRYTPFEAQLETAAFLTLYERAFVLNDIGTGKTLSVLWAFDYLRKEGRAEKLLVAAPLSTLDTAWSDEIFHNFPHLSFEVVHGTKRKRQRLLQEDVDVYILNHDGVHVLQADLATRNDITHVAVDEIALAARNGRTRRWKSLNKLINDKKWPKVAWGMTGTPTPNLPTDAWAQAKLIAPDTTPYLFTKFRRITMKQQGPFLWVPRANANAAVKHLMRPAIRYARDEVIDLPDLMYEDRDVVLSPEQAKAYRDMANTLMAEVADGKILAVNEAVKASKLVQIACGVAYDSKNNEVTLDCKNRLTLLREVIDETQFKVIVFVPFISTIKLVALDLAKHGHAPAVVHGGVTKNKRAEIFRDFQRLSEPNVLVAQPAAMSHGLTLTEANMIVWYAPVISNDTYTQANGRITRAGQVNKQFIIHLAGTEIEKKIYQRLRGKQRMQGILLDAVQAARGDFI